MATRKQGTIPQNPIGEVYVWRDYFQRQADDLAQGVSSVTVTIPKLTGGGSNGSITIFKGIVTNVVQPT